MMSMLSYLNLVKYYSLFVNEVLFWVVMLYFAGGSALNLMKWSYSGGFEEFVIVCIVKVVFKVLDYFYCNGNIY